MKRQMILGMTAAVVIVPIAAAAQQAGTLTEMQPARTAQVAGGRGRLMAVTDAKITTGRPYSAEAVTQTTQVLADGNRINRESIVRVFRDGEGRTRRETLAADGAVRSIAISDPVAQVTYTLDPSQKTAFKGAINLLGATRVLQGTAAVGGGGGGRPATREGQVAVTTVGGGEAVAMRTPAPDDPNVRKEDLGSQNIEGVAATGTRTTTVIPAGQIGNVQEIRIVSEQWFSEELQALVMTRHADPRSGETVYRLRNILRAEPDQSLFSVPADYTVRQRR